MPHLPNTWDEVSAPYGGPKRDQRHFSAKTMDVIRQIFVLLLIGLTVSCGNTQDGLDSRERIDLIDDPYVSGLRTCIRLAKLDELEEASNNRKSEEIRLWIGFDESPLYGILLRRAELSYSGDIISCHENKYSIERLQLSNAEWSEIWKDAEKSELRELRGTEEFGFSDKYLDDTNVVVEYRNNCNYLGYSRRAAGIHTSERAAVVTGKLEHREIRGISAHQAPEARQNRER